MLRVTSPLQQQFGRERNRLISPIDEFTSELLLPSQAGICLVPRSMD